MHSTSVVCARGACSWHPVRNALEATAARTGDQHPCARSQRQPARLSACTRWQPNETLCVRIGAAGALYKEAVELYAQDPVASLAYDIVQRGVELLLKAQKWDDAAAMLMQWASVCLAQKSHPHLCRAYLGAPTASVEC